MQRISFKDKHFIDPVWLPLGEHITPLTTDDSIVVFTCADRFLLATFLKRYSLIIPSTRWSPTNGVYYFVQQFVNERVGPLLLNGTYAYELQLHAGTESFVDGFKRVFASGRGAPQMNFNTFAKADADGSYDPLDNSNLLTWQAAQKQGAVSIASSEYQGITGQLLAGEKPLIAVMPNFHFLELP